MSGRYVFEQARVVDPAAGIDEVRDVVVADGVIAAADAAAGAERIDARGLVLAPGLVDLHAHLREPGEEHKETIATGTRAAAAGGFTAIAAMANTVPVTDHAAIVHEVRDLAAAAGSCDVFPVGAITKGMLGESLAEMGEMVDAGVRVFSDDGRCVPDGQAAAQRADLCQGVPGRGGARRPRRGRLAGRGRAHARGAAVVLARACRPARRGGGDRGGPRHRDGSRHGRAAAPVPPVERPSGRAGATRQGRRGPGHRGGDATPSGVHRRGPRDLRHGQEDEPAAALGRGSRRPARRGRRRDDRCHRHRPCPARRRGKGHGVRPGAAGDDRPGNRPCRRADVPGRAGDRLAVAGDRGALDDPGAHPRRRRPRRPDRAGTSRQPGRVRSGRGLDGRAAVRLEGAQQRLHGAAAAGAGAVHDARRRR